MRRFGLKKRSEMALGRLALFAALRIAKRLTPEKIERWGRKLGGFIYVASRRYRGVAIRNLRAAYPEWSEQEVRDVARRTFENFARGALEFLYLNDMPPQAVGEWLSVEDTSPLDAVLEKGRGAIVITAHLGNWELLARKFALLGYRINVIARDSDDPTTTGLANSIRENAGYKVLSRDSSAIPAMRCLRKNELLGILPDQNTWSGIFVDFFGRPAATATGPAVLSLKTGAPILCGFARRVDGGFFEAVIYPPLEVPSTGDEEADILALTQAYTRVIEDEIRKDPAQWLWIHDRWRRSAECI
ncbi:MAG: hypothetical protein HYX78_10415 [Armatimonadetes bacterium]|nr:hypothetical protein [Armatimonadota bacterium]